MEINERESLFSRISNLADQGLWFPHSSEKMTGVPVDPDITDVLAYISARKVYPEELSVMLISISSQGQQARDLCWIEPEEQ